MWCLCQHIGLVRVGWGNRVPIEPRGMSQCLLSNLALHAGGLVSFAVIRRRFMVGAILGVGVFDRGHGRLGPHFILAPSTSLINILLAR